MENYDFQAEPIRYNDIIFRSKLECQCYIYISEKTSLKVEYEPTIEFNHLWPPDFACYHKGKLEYLVEVKPKSELFDVVKYIVLSNSIGAKLLCMDYNNSYEFKHTGFTIFPHDEFDWKRSWNKMKMLEQNGKRTTIL